MAIGGMVYGNAEEVRSTPESGVIVQKLSGLCELANELEVLAANRLVTLIPVRPQKDNCTEPVYVCADAPLFAEMADCLNKIKMHIDNTMATIRMTEV